MCFRIKNIKIHTEVMTEVEQDFTFQMTGGWPVFFSIYTNANVCVYSQSQAVLLSQEGCTVTEPH